MGEDSLPPKDDIDTTKLFAAVGATALYIGLLFDFGYFWALDLNYFTLLSYKDHLAALALFAVPCLFLAFLFAGFRIRSKSQRFDFAMCCWIALVFIIWTATAPLIAPVLSPVFTNFAFWFKGLSLPFLIAYLTALILGFFITPKGSKERKDAEAWIGLVVIGLAVLIMMFGSFWYRAAARGSQFETEVTLTADGKTESRPQNAYIVRVLDGGIFMILQDAPDRVVFVKKDAIVMLSKKVKR
jgi:hypothetical protein